MSIGVDTPSVILAGAGPGDPDLITVKTLRYIKIADVIIVDRLVNQTLLNHAKSGVKIFSVGKEGGNPCSFSQEAINELLVSEARQGRIVLRLKGGDISFFSNIATELEVLTENAIRYEIVPGITAASGAAAYAGIPLTARNYSSAVRFLSYAHPDQIDEEQVREWVSANDTLVFYMASRNFQSLIARLLRRQASEDWWVAVIEQATTPGQRVIAHPIGEFLFATQDVRFKSPSIIIVGSVAKLHERYQWFDASRQEDDFFGGLQAVINSAKVA